MKNRLCIYILILCSSISLPCFAQSFSDSEKQALYNNLVKETRCVTCPNQSISDSQAPVAQALREKIYQMVDQGHSYTQIKTGLIAQYGERISYKPMYSVENILLWLGPIGLLLLAMMWLKRNYETK